MHSASVHTKLPNDAKAIVTGQGIHSRHGVPILLPAVLPGPYAARTPVRGQRWAWWAFVDTAQSTNQGQEGRGCFLKAKESETKETKATTRTCVRQSERITSIVFTHGGGERGRAGLLHFLPLAHVMVLLK